MTRAWRAAALAAVAAAGCGGGGSNTDCDSSIIPGDLVITEVFADADAPTGSSGADDGREWFEIYNTSSRPLDLTGIRVVHSRGDGTMAHDTTLLPVTIAPGDYLVLGNVAPDLKPAYVDYGYASALGDLYNTGTGRISLACGETEIDAADYEQVAPGVSRQLDGGRTPDYTVNDDLANWCAATANAIEFEPANFGTPGAANEECTIIVAGMCNDGGTLRPIMMPAEGDLVITEVMPNPDLTDDALGEWFEVRAMTDVDLNGLTVDRFGDTSPGELIESEDCIHVAAGDYAVLARSADSTMNGGLPPVAATFGFSMVTGSPSAPGDVAISYIQLDVDVLIDSFAWTGSSTGASLQVDPDFATAAANDDETKWCDGTTPYGVGDLGTPGAANAECVILPPPGMCDVGDGTLRDIVHPVVGDLVITEVMPSPNAVSDAAGEWFEAVALANFDLNDLGLDRAGDTAAPDVIASVMCRPVMAGTYLVFARNADPTMNGGLPAVDATFGFSLIGGSVAAPGDVQVLVDTTVIDAVTWTGSANGAARSLDPAAIDPVANDDEANFCDATTPYGLGDLGTPGAANPACASTGATCIDGTTGLARPIVSPVPGDLVITEMMPSPNAVSDTVGEWFEVVATADVDLNGVGLDRAADTAAPNVIASANCVSLAAGSYAVFARSSDPATNGGLMAVTATFSFSLIGGSAAAPGDIRLIAADTTTILDAVSWTSSRNGASLSLDPDFTDPGANDVESNYCDGTIDYGMADLGTPAAANPQCAVVVPPGMCIDGGTGLVRPIDRPIAGEVAITEWMANPTVVADTAGEWIEIRALTDFDLNEIQLGDDTLATTPAVTATTCLPVMAGTYVLFAQATDPAVNGGLPAVDGVFPSGVDLVNSSGTVLVGSGGAIVAMQTYATAAAGVSTQIDAGGVQCNAPAGTGTYNGTDVGTPKAAETVACP